MPLVPIFSVHLCLNVSVIQIYLSVTRTCRNSLLILTYILSYGETMNATKQLVWTATNSYLYTGMFVMFEHFKFESFYGESLTIVNAIYDNKNQISITRYHCPTRIIF